MFSWKCFTFICWYPKHIRYNNDDYNDDDGDDDYEDAEDTDEDTVVAANDCISLVFLEILIDLLLIKSEMIYKFNIYLT